MIAERQTGEIVGIQYLRGIAAVAVVLHHLLETIGDTPFGKSIPDWFVTSGAAGVDLFFVISGFIMVHVSFPEGRASASPGKFLLRRATRIFPFYWLICLFVIAMGALGFYRQMDFSAVAIASSLTLLPIHSLIGVSWTLSYEMLFYLIFALALFAHNQRLVVAISSVLLVLVFIAGNVAMPEGRWHNFLARPIIFEFACGMFAALAFRIWGNRVTVPLWCGIAAGVVLIVVPMFTGFPNTEGLIGWPRFFAWGLPSVVLLLSVLKIQPGTGPFARTSELLGDASYAIYLTHPIAVIAYAYLLTRWLAPFPTALTAFVVLLLTLVGGVIAHLLIENPLLGIARKLLGLRLPFAIINRKNKLPGS